MVERTIDHEKIAELEAKRDKLKAILIEREDVLADWEKYKIKRAIGKKNRKINLLQHPPNPNKKKRKNRS